MYALPEPCCSIAVSAVSELAIKLFLAPNLAPFCNNGYGTPAAFCCRMITL